MCHVYYTCGLRFREGGLLFRDAGLIFACKRPYLDEIYIWRLFKAYGYNCFAIFDCDADPQTTAKIFTGIINNNKWVTGESEFEITNTFAYFGVDFEKYFRSSINDYSDLEKDIANDYKITSKPGKAKAVAQMTNQLPEFINKLEAELCMIEIFGQ